MATKKTSATLPHLVEWRANRELTQADLAREAGIGLATVKRAEAGGAVRPLILAKMARALKVSTDDLRERRPADLKASA